MLKNILKWVLFLFLAIVLLGGGFAVHEWNAKPLFVNNFFNRFALKMALQSPETLTSLHFLESMGIDGHNADLDDESVESTTEFFKYLASEKQVLLSYDDGSLSADEKMSKRIALYLLDFAEDSEKFRFHNYPVNQLFGVQNGFPTFMEAQHQVNSIEDAEFYISRLKQLPRKFAQVTDGLKIREDQQILPPTFVVT